MTPSALPLWRISAACLFTFALALPAQAQNARDRADAPAPLASIDARTGAVSAQSITFEQLSGAASASRGASSAAIFSETFSSGVPPAGWASFQNALGTSVVWTAAATDGNPAPSALNAFDSSPPGSNNCGTSPALCAQDYLVTPQIAIPAAGYRLRFDQRQGFTADFGSRYAVLVSTTSQTDPAAFTPVATWTEVLGPNGEVIPTTNTATGPIAWYRLSLDLSAYAGQSIYIAFRHTNDDGDDFRLDNVYVETIPVAVPECAINFNPANGTTGVPYGTAPITMSWAEATSGDPANGFLLDIGTDPGATNIANGVQWGLQRAVNLTNTTPGTTYYWRIRPYNAVGTNATCPINSYTTQGAISTFPFQADFGSPTCAVPANWTTTGTPTTTETWVFTTTRTSGALSDHTTGTGCFAAAPDATPQNTALNLVMPLFNSNGLTTLRLSFWLQNRRSGTTPVSETHVDVSTDGGATYTLGVASYTAVLTAWTQQTVNLDAYINQPNLRIRFRVVESTGTTSDVSLDDILLAPVPTAPIFSATPSSDPVLMGTAGACSITPSTSQTFTITNLGVGTLNVTGAAIAGGSSAAYSVNTANLPAALGAGQSVTVSVLFAPPPGMTGAQTGVLQISYDDGTPQVATRNLSGTASATNVAIGTGAGYAFRNALAACATGSPVSAPGTALIPFTGHTKIATGAWTGSEDDGWFEIDAATLDGLIAGGSFRFFGRTFESLRVTTNGNVFFNMTTYDAAADRNITLPNTANGGAVIAAAAMDLEVTAADYATDNAGIGGTPGVWYGTADVDSDGDAELVITYYHAYDFGAASLPATTGAFLTFQIVLMDGGAPNVEDHVEIRYLDGNDANGVPFRQNTAGAPVENDVAIGLSTIGGTAAAEYRDNSATVGGPVYTAGGSGVRFQAETQATADGGGGWRMMGAPVAAYTVGRLADLNLVQSVTGQYPDFPTENLYTDWSGTEWTPAADVVDVLTPGQGFLWYLFDTNLVPDPASYGGGTSRSFALPMALQGTGAEVQTATPYAITLHATGDGWDLVANPYRSSLDVSGLASWAQGGALVSGVGQIWDPAGSYVATTDPAVNNVVTPWQGFMVQNSLAGGATSLAVPPAARTTGGTFVGRTDDDGERRVVAFRLTGATPEGTATVDRAALLYFTEDAGAAWDLMDATKLRPLADRYATIAFLGDRDGTTVLKAQESRALDAGGSFEVPMAVTAVGTAPTLTLAWPTFDNVPAEWSLTLRDLVTGAEVDLRAQESYTFSAAPTALRGGAGAAPVLGSAEMERADARFVLVVSSVTTAGEGNTTLPTEFALHAPAPNPVVGASALVRFDLPEQADASVEVYDLLGRRVATLAEGAREAGRHTARLDASALASGVYVVRMRAGDFVQAQRVTISR